MVEGYPFATRRSFKFRSFISPIFSGLGLMSLALSSVAFAEPESTSLARRDQLRLGSDACMSIIAGTNNWSRLSDDANRFGLHHWRESRPDLYAEALFYAPTQLIEYYKSLGFHIDLDRKGLFEDYRFDGFQYAANHIQQLRRRAAIKLKTSTDEIIQPKMLFKSTGALPKYLDIDLGQEIPFGFHPSQQQVMTGRGFYQNLDRNILPLASPTMINVLGRDTEHSLMMTEHDFSHLFGFLVARPEALSAIRLLSKIIVSAQDKATALEELITEHSELASPLQFNQILDIAPDIAANGSGIPHLWTRLFFMIESLYLVSPEAPLGDLGVDLHFFKMANLEQMKDFLNQASEKALEKIRRQILSRVKDFAIPFGGAAGDLHYSFHHWSDLLGPDHSNPHRHDWGLMTSIGRIRWYEGADAKILRDKNAERFKAYQAEDLAKILILIREQQKVPPEIMIQDALIDPITKLDQELDRELLALKRAVASKTSSFEKKSQFQAPDLAFRLPPVDPRSPTGQLFQQNLWVNSERIWNLFGLDQK